MSQMPAPPDPILLVRLQALLKVGQHDYDYVAGRIHATCYNDEYVMRKILAAHPQDVPSSGEEEEEYSTSDASEGVDDQEAVSDIRAGGEISKESGSMNDPVVLEDDEVVENQQKKAGEKRKQISIGDNVEVMQKKPKPSSQAVLCLKCGAKFDPDKNKEGVCHYHPSKSVLGELELNPTSDDIHDDEASRERWPNAFEWECCEANFDEDEDEDTRPCEHGKHKADGGDQTEYSRRRARQRQRNRYYG